MLTHTPTRPHVFNQLYHILYDFPPFLCKSQQLTPKSARVLMFLSIWLSECRRAEAPLRVLTNPTGTYLSSCHERNARRRVLPTLKPTNDTAPHCMNLCMYIHGHVSQSTHALNTWLMSQLIGLLRLIPFALTWQFLFFKMKLIYGYLKWTIMRINTLVSCSFHLVEQCQTESAVA